jgi:CheY-like chemotaxis protein
MTLNGPFGFVQNAALPLRPPPAGRPQRRMWGVDVLVVDDDEADTALILGVLKRNPDVTSARGTDSPEFALRQFAAGIRPRPNLLLLDVHMPKMDGFSFLEGLRKVPSMAGVPVVFLTTSALGSDVARTHQTSAALYVLKPNSQTELQSRLNGVIRLAAAGRLAS